MPHDELTSAVVAVSQIRTLRLPVVKSTSVSPPSLNRRFHSHLLQHPTHAHIKQQRKEDTDRADNHNMTGGKAPRHLINPVAALKTAPAAREARGPTSSSTSNSRHPTLTPYNGSSRFERAVPPVCAYSTKQGEAIRSSELTRLRPPRPVADDEALHPAEASRVDLRPVGRLVEPPSAYAGAYIPQGNDSQLIILAASS